MRGFGGGAHIAGNADRGPHSELRSATMPPKKTKAGPFRDLSTAAFFESSIWRKMEEMQRSTVVQGLDGVVADNFRWLAQVQAQIADGKDDFSGAAPPVMLPKTPDQKKAAWKRRRKVATAEVDLQPVRTRLLGQYTNKDPLETGECSQRSEVQVVVPPTPHYTGSNMEEEAEEDEMDGEGCDGEEVVNETMEEEPPPATPPKSLKRRASRTDLGQPPQKTPKDAAVGPEEKSPQPQQTWGRSLTPSRGVKTPGRTFTKTPIKTPRDRTFDKTPTSAARGPGTPSRSFVKTPVSLRRPLMPSRDGGGTPGRNITKTPATVVQRTPSALPKSARPATTGARAVTGGKMGGSLAKALGPGTAARLGAKFGGGGTPIPLPLVHDPAKLDAAVAKKEELLRERAQATRREREERTARVKARAAELRQEQEQARLKPATTGKLKAPRVELRKRAEARRQAAEDAQRVEAAKAAKARPKAHTSVSPCLSPAHAQRHAHGLPTPGLEGEADVSDPEEAGPYSRVGSLGSKKIRGTFELKVGAAAKTNDAHKDGEEEVAKSISSGRTASLGSKALRRDTFERLEAECAAEAAAEDVADNYNIDDLDSEEETDDENAPKKPIPLWAFGEPLKGALIRQYYQTAVDPMVLFGPTYAPVLDRMFTHNRRRFHKRTSSADWDSPLLPPPPKKPKMP